MRTAVSTGPPGVAGTMIWMGRAGNRSWAAAAPTACASATSATYLSLRNGDFIDRF